MNIRTVVEKMLAEEHVSLFGCADLSAYGEALAASGGKIVAGYPRGLSIGVALANSIVDFLPDRADDNIAAEYFFNAYHYVNNRLDHIATKLSCLLNGRGFRTLPVPAAERTDIDNARATVSHKMIARLAGLGWIGKNCLLITPQYGPRIRFVSLLTEAPLKPSAAVLESKCGACTECADICPVKALHGKPFNEAESRDVRFNFRLCRDYFAEMGGNPNHKPVCGMCLYVCPHGRKKRG